MASSRPKYHLRDHAELATAVVRRRQEGSVEQVCYLELGQVRDLLPV